jgi:hypothetical protein
MTLAGRVYVSRVEVFWVLGMAQLGSEGGSAVNSFLRARTHRPASPAINNPD